MELNELNLLATKYQRYCNNTIKIDLCDRPIIKAPKVIFNNGSDVYTDHETIVIGLQSLMDCKDEDEAFMKINYFLGHEVQHIRSTPNKTWLWGQREGLKVILEKIAEKQMPNKDILLNTDDDIDNFIEELKKNNYSISLPILKRLVHFVMNSLEDGRIEKLRAHKHPSFKKLMIVFRGKEWNKYEVTGEKDEDELTLILNQILTLSTTSLYQKNFLEHYEGTKTEEKIKKLHKNIALAVISKRNKECMEQGIEICRKIAEEMIKKANVEDLNDLLKQILDNIDSNSNGLKDGEYSSDMSNEETNNDVLDSLFGESELELELTEDEYNKLRNSSNGNLSDKGVAVKVKVVDENGKDITEDIKEKETKGDNSLSKFDRTPRRGKRNVGDITDSTEENKIPDIINKVKEEMKKASEEALGESKTRKEAANKIKNPNSCLTEDDTPNVDVSDINKNYYKNSRIHFTEYKREYDVSDIIPADIQAKINTFKRKIQAFFNNQEKLSVKNKKSGLIDNNGIYKLAMKQIDVFYKKGIKYQFDGCCYILCDNSGSMGYGEHSKRSEACRAMAMVEKAFDDKMPLKLVAFDASSNNIVHHEIIKNWNERFTKSTAYNFLKKGRSGECNKDGYSIRVATKELRSRPEKKKILFVLSDGTPSAYSYNGTEDVSNAVDEARKLGIEVVSIFFPDSYNSAREQAEFKKMYKFNTITTTPEGITNELVRVLKRFIGI